MNEDSGEDRGSTMSREQRLAAKLRENLRRRKAQSRQMGRAADSEADNSGESGLPKDGGKS